LPESSLVTPVVLMLSPFIAIALGITVGAMWKYHWLGLAVLLNLCALSIPLVIKGYVVLWCMLFACSGIAAAVTYRNCKSSVGKAWSWLVGTLSAPWFTVPYIIWFLMDPNGGPSRTIPWSPLASLLAFSGTGAAIACCIYAFVGGTDQRIGFAAQNSEPQPPSAGN